MDTKDLQENVVEMGVGYGYEGSPVQRLRRPPRREGEEILLGEILGEEEPLKSERVEEELRAMPAWELTLEGQAITQVKELPTPEVAALYTAYVTGLAGYLGLPVAVSVTEGLVLVTLYGPRRSKYMGGLTESVLELARQIG